MKLHDKKAIIINAFMNKKYIVEMKKKIYITCPKNQNLKAVQQKDQT